MNVAAARLMRIAAEVLPQERPGFLRAQGRNLSTSRASLAALAPLVEADPRQPTPESLLDASPANPFGGMGEGRPTVGRMGGDLLRAAGRMLSGDADLSGSSDLFTLAGDLLLVAPEARLDADLVDLWPYLERLQNPGMAFDALGISDERVEGLMRDEGFMDLARRVHALRAGTDARLEPTEAPHLARRLAPVWFGRASPEPEPLPEDLVERLTYAASSPRMDWAAPPTLAGEWTELGPHEAGIVLTLVGEAVRLGEKRWPITLEHACDRVRTRPVANHGGGLVVEMQGYGDGGEAGVVSALVLDRRVFLADGTSATLHRATDAVGARLDTPEARRDFLILFAGWVRSDDGRFQILTGPQDLRPRFAGDPARFEDVSRLIEPLVDLGRGEDGRWGLDATVLYGDAVFRARFKLNELGQVTMVDERVVAEDLPLLDEVWNEPLVHLIPERNDA